MKTLNTKTERIEELRELTSICIDRFDKWFTSDKNKQNETFKIHERLIESFKIEDADWWKTETDESELEFLTFIFDDSDDEDVIKLQSIIEKWTVKGVKINENVWHLYNINLTKKKLTICIDSLLDEIQESSTDEAIKAKEAKKKANKEKKAKKAKAKAIVEKAKKVESIKNDRENFKKSLIDSQETLKDLKDEVLDFVLFDEEKNDVELKVWKELNKAIQAIEDARTIIFKGEKNSKNK